MISVNSKMKADFLNCTIDQVGIKFKTQCLIFGQFGKSFLNFRNEIVKKQKKEQASVVNNNGQHIQQTKIVKLPLTSAGKNNTCRFKAWRRAVGGQAIQYLFDYMKNTKEEEEIRDISKANQPNSRAFSQKFEILNSSVTHENRLEVELKSTKNERLQIKNYFANISQDKIIKITQIELEDRVIKIIDTFTSTPSARINKNNQIQYVKTEVSQDVQAHKKLLEKKPRLLMSDNGQEDGKIRDVRNVVKNIFRLFQSWVEDNTISELCLAGSLAHLLNKTGKYNNSLIIAISKDPALRKAFIAFSGAPGEQYIMQSKIHDKESHIQALHTYRKFCNGEETFEYEVKDNNAQGFEIPKMKYGKQQNHPETGTQSEKIQ